MVLSVIRCNRVLYGDNDHETMWEMSKKQGLKVKIEHEFSRTWGCGHQMNSDV